MSHKGQEEYMEHKMEAKNTTYRDSYGVLTIDCEKCGTPVHVGTFLYAHDCKDNTPPNTSTAITEVVESIMRVNDDDSHWMDGDIEQNVYLIQALISTATRQARIEELNRLSQSGHAHFTAPMYIENRIKELENEK